MMSRRHPLIIASVLALGLTLSGCESFELPVDWFNNKKPLPGERRSVFPEGVPGVPQGVPAELQQGYQPPSEPPPQAAEVEQKPKPKPKPKPRQAAAPAQTAPSRPATSLTVQPQGQQQSGAQAPWPSPRQTASQPAPSQSPFPDPPAR
jgi:hypothetical protein